MTEASTVPSVVDVQVDDRIAWVTLNRPEKRNAMSPSLNREMNQVLEELEQREDVGVVVLTGAGESFSAGMDLKEYFRETEGQSALQQSRVRKQATDWMWRRLTHYPKPTIAMVNGWCFGAPSRPWWDVISLSPPMKRPSACRR